ncbi:ABC transporter permease [Halalkalibacter okhensis]|uniref:ABC transporter n=1 Tax=Halalkalibacter okhensis TaxID=333138 RepID=A0A0B0IBZ6_9BACI|nr:ABC transporter permease [Halalkalibacter okhensis]KHF40113.1 ABC transporter [Halalkalibacter okhensis]
MCAKLHAKNFAHSWFSVVLGLLAKNAESASAFTFFILFLPYVSSAFVPTETMPTWLHAFADNQPMTPLIETLRGLLINTPIENNGWLSIIWFGGLLILSVLMASIIFNYRKKN